MKLNFNFMNEPMAPRTKKILMCVVAIAMAMPAASQYMNNVVKTDVDCTASYKGKIVHIEQSQTAPAPTNATFYHSDDAGWMKDKEITDLTCKELKK